MTSSAQVLAVICAIFVMAPQGPGKVGSTSSVLADHLLVTWYGNPHSRRMGVLGERTGSELAAALRAQGAAYEKFTPKRVLLAYHLVTVVAQCTPGSDGQYRRRESADVVRSLLADARANGFRLILDVQVGRSSVAAEVAALRPFLGEPDVDLALDPEFAVSDCEVPGKTIGSLYGADVNAALDELERLIADRHLPPKVLIVHQFRWDMLPDKKRIRRSATVDVVLNMDGFGSQALKLSSYRAIMQQGELPFAGIKLFYRQDTHLFTPGQVMALRPTPSVVIYQ
jgi:hypothetical protein